MQHHPAAPRAQTPLTLDDLLYASIKNVVIAFELATGRELWRTKLDISSGATLRLLARNNLVIAAGHGHIFALDAATGVQLWTDGLKGLGYGGVSLAMHATLADPESFATAASPMSDSAGGGVGVGDGGDGGDGGGDGGGGGD